MPCGCNKATTTQYIYTPADPTKKTQVFGKEIQAKVAQIKDGGGGTITTRAK